ncbi:MAG: DUF4089 domain-containing protein [Rhodospirillales bacterium]|nr:MAG: DUF4089 domain-containing protein [Rhodospirillales bacterium]
MTNDEDIAAYVDAAAKAIGLPIDPAYRAAVIANVTIAKRIADAALVGPLPDATENAPVFEP